MSAVAFASRPGLVERVTQLLDRVEVRPADTGEEWEAVKRLRYDAYLREEAIAPNPHRTFADHYDALPNAFVFGLHVDGRLASSIRLHIISQEFPDGPSAGVFPDFVGPQLAEGKILIDPTRFVADHIASRWFPELPYVTVRLTAVAAQYFDADLCLATVRAEHQAFYKRVFGCEPFCPPRSYPTLKKPITLMACDVAAMRTRIAARYPFFVIRPGEGRALFERPAALSAVEPAVRSMAVGE